MKRGRGSQVVLLAVMCVALWAAASGLASGATMTGAALGKLAADPHAANAQQFTFIVLGDSRTNFALQGAIISGESAPLQPEAFHRIIAESNLLAPAFLIDVGDLILGYTGDQQLASREWDEFDKVVAASRQPFFPVAGNHDIWDAPSRLAWTKRLGPAYYSFDYGNSHFIALDSEEQTSAMISPEQVAWLKADLETHKAADNIFVFLHQPMFVNPDYEKSNWSEVHALLTRYPVRAVFAGHWHQYERLAPKDGIERVVTGGGGAEIGPEPQEGDFYHYLLVKVDGRQFSYSVIKPGSVESPEVVTEESRRQLSMARENAKIAEGPTFLAGQPIDTEVRFSLTNPSAKPATATVRWEPGSFGIEATPSRAECRLEPNGSGSVTLRLRGPADSLRPADVNGEGVPRAIISMPYPNGDRMAEFGISVYQMIGRALCPRATKPPKIDGDLSDWSGVPAYPLVQVEYGKVPRDANDFSATVRFMWDDRNLYVAAEVRDDIRHVIVSKVRPYGDDALFLGKPGFWTGLTLDDSGHVTVRNVAGDTIQDLSKQISAAVVTTGSVTRYEAAWPRELLPKGALQQGQSFQVHISATDRDDKSSQPGCPARCLGHDFVIVPMPAS